MKSKETDKKIMIIAKKPKFVNKLNNGTSNGKNAKNDVFLFAFLDKYCT